MESMPSSVPDLRADFVLVTALPEELDAVLGLLPGYRQLPPEEAHIRTYYQAELPVTFSDRSTGTYRLIVMCLLGMGRLQAATATADAIRRWHPRYILLVGIAGGLATQNVQIGDILVSDQVVDYELQKETPHGAEMRWEVQRADARLLNAWNNFRDEAWQAQIKMKRPGRGQSAVHKGPIASGDKIVAFGEFLAKYQAVWPKLVGVEMEAAGVSTAAFQSSDRPGFFMIRGVSDLADEQKNTRRVKKWRLYACEAAASFAIAFLKSGPVPVKGKDREVIELDDQANPSLPLPPPHFVGRERKLASLTAELTRANTDTAIALVGMGGVGKSALAKKLAAGLTAAFPGGIFWTEYPAYQEGALSILSLWAGYCDKHANLPSGLPARASFVRDLLAARRNQRGPLLLVLDNVRGDSPGDVAALKSARPADVPLLLTTRDIELALAYDAQPVLLEVLSGPEALEVLGRLAGQAVQSDPESAGRLAAQLGGLPLALNLAGKLAARSQRQNKILADLCRNLESHPAVEALKIRGEASLIDIFYLSYSALNEDQQRLFRGLGAFAPGSASPRHVGMILGLDIRQVEDQMNLLESLSLGSWVEGPAEDLFTLHPLLHEYAVILLQEAGLREEAAVRAAHAEYYLAFARAHATEAPQHLDALEREAGNLLAAFDWAYRQGHGTSLVEFALALRHFFSIRGYWREGKARLEQALPFLDQVAGNVSRTTLDLAYAMMLYNLNDYEGAKHRLGTALARAESRQDLEWIKRFRYHLGLVLSDMEKYEEALVALQQGLEITPKEDGLFTVSFKLLIGKCFIRLELYDRAQLQLEECLEIQHRENILADLRYTHFYLGMLFSYQARYPEARPHYELALDLAKAQREQGLLADLKSDLGEVLVHLGEVDQGKSLIEQAQALAEKIGNQDLVRYIQEDLWPSLAPLLP